MKTAKTIFLGLVLPGGVVILIIGALIWAKKLPTNFWTLNASGKWKSLKALVTPALPGLE